MKNISTTEYQRQYRDINPVWVDYYRVLNQVRHICLRIREDALGLRASALKKADLEFKKQVDLKMKPGMTWQNYGINWYLKGNKIIDKLKKGYNANELMSPSHFYVDYKSTNNLRN